MQVHAGFECGRVHGGTHDLLEATGHTPKRQMAQHYHIARMHGARWARDGIPPDVEPKSRMLCAALAGIKAIWDLDHFWQHEDPEGYARRIGVAAWELMPTSDLWVCPMNEPETVPLMTGATWKAAVAKGRRMLEAIREVHPVLGGRMPALAAARPCWKCDLTGFRSHWSTGRWSDGLPIAVSPPAGRTSFTGMTFARITKDRVSP